MKLFVLKFKAPFQIFTRVSKHIQPILFMILTSQANYERLNCTYSVSVLMGCNMSSINVLDCHPIADYYDWRINELAIYWAKQDKIRSTVEKCHHRISNIRHVNGNWRKYTKNKYEILVAFSFCHTRRFIFSFCGVLKYTHIILKLPQYCSCAHA